MASRTITELWQMTCPDCSSTNTKLVKSHWSGETPQYELVCDDCGKKDYVNI